MLLSDWVLFSLLKRNYIRDVEAIQEGPSLQLKFKCLLYILPINSLQHIRKTGMMTCFLHQILHHPLDRLDYNACSLQGTVNKEGLQRKFGTVFSLENILNIFAWECLENIVVTYLQLHTFQIGIIVISRSITHSYGN